MNWNDAATPGYVLTLIWLCGRRWCEFEAEFDWHTICVKYSAIRWNRWRWKQRREMASLAAPRRVNALQTNDSINYDQRLLCIIDLSYFFHQLICLFWLSSRWVVDDRQVGRHEESEESLTSMTKNPRPISWLICLMNSFIFLQSNNSPQQNGVVMGADEQTTTSTTSSTCYCPIWTIRPRQWVYRGEGNSSLCLALPQVLISFNFIQFHSI